MSLYLKSILVAVVAVVMCNGGKTMSADENAAFRVNTDIYDDVSKPPIKRSLTLFYEGVYYDLDDLDSSQVTVIDPVRSRIILIDRTRKIQTRLSMPEVDKKVSAALLQMDPKLSKFLTTSNLKSSSDDVVVVGNENLKYECRLLQVPDPSISEQYATFADWSARINAIIPPSRPPFLRLQLNQAIRDRTAIPEELERITNYNGKESKLTCRILPNWKLSTDDVKTIERIGGMLTQFEQTDIETFLKK
jgi:hypothetical protein